MRGILIFVLVLAAGAVASDAAAQVQVVEEEEVPDEQVVERGYVRGQGRGVQYGAHLVSPFYLTDIRRAGFDDGRRSDDRIPPAYGAGLRARIGWEFPLGFTIEVFGGLAVSGFDTGGADTSNLLSRAEVGVGGRYMIFNDTALVPFIEIGAAVRWFDLDWPSSTDIGRSSEIGWSPTGVLHASVGAQIELSPYFGIELGLTAEYSFGADIFAEGLFALMPFLGVTLYVQDENDPV